MAYVTPSNVGAFLNKIMAPQVSNALTESAAKLAMIPDYSDSAVHTGAHQYRIKKLSGGTAADRTLGAPVSPTNFTYTGVDVTANESYVAIEYDHQTLKSLTLRDIENDVMQAARIVGERLVTTALSTLTTGASSTEGTINTAVDQDAILSVVGALDDAKVPQGNRFLIVSGATRQDIAKITEYQNAFSYAGTLLTGEYRQIEGLNLDISALLPNTTTGHINLAFHPLGVGQVFIPQIGNMDNPMAMKSVSNIGGVPISILWEQIPKSNGSWMLTVSCIHGSVVVNDAAVIGLYGK